MGVCCLIFLEWESQTLRTFDGAYYEFGAIIGKNARNGREISPMPG